MGNRAVITTREDFNNNGIGIYLHCNGGRDSIEAFLAYCKAKRFRKPEEDNYGYSYLTAVIANFFSDGLSISVDRIDKLDCNNGDNGVYLIENWEIVDRKFNGSEQSGNDFLEMIKTIDERQPSRMQLTFEEWCFLSDYYNKKKSIKNDKETSLEQDIPF